MRNRTILLATIVFTLTFLSSFAKGQRDMAVDPQTRTQKILSLTEQDNDVPFACSLTALTAAEREHHKQLSRELHSAITETRELPNGYAFRLSGERRSLALASEWVSLERLCCPFFTFQIEAGSEAQPIWLRMTGREGVKQFMRSEFGIK